MNVYQLISRLQLLTNSRVTQTELGKCLNKSRSDINGKAKRGTSFKLEELERISNYFKISLKDLIKTEPIQTNLTHIANIRKFEKMRYNEVLNRLQNLINYTPSQAELCQILNMKQSTMSNRANRNSEISADEIEKINKYYAINLFTTTLQANPSCSSVSESFIIIAPENAQSITVRINSGQTVKVEVI